MTPSNLLATILTLTFVMTFNPSIAANIAGVDVPPPLPAVDVVDTLWGQPVPDPWRRLEDLTDPAVQGWMRQQADATLQILNRIPGRAALVQRLRKIDDGAAGQVGNVVRCPDGSHFYLRRNPDEEQFKVVRRGVSDNTDTVVLDPSQIERGGGPKAAVMDYQPSPDGRRLAYSLQTGGAEQGTLHVIDLATGRALIEPVTGVRYPQVSWRGDSSGFFYTRLREGYGEMSQAQRQLDQQRRYRTLDGEAGDRFVMSASQAPELGLPNFTHPGVFEIPGTEQAGAWIAYGVEPYGALAIAEMRDVLQGRARWRLVVSRADEVIAASMAEGNIYLLSTRDAPRGRVLRLSLKDPVLARATVVVPQGEGVIVSIAAARDALYLTRRSGVQVVLNRLPHAAAPPAAHNPLQRVELPVEGRVALRYAHPQQDGVVLAVGGWTMASRIWTYDSTKAEARLLPLGRAGRFDVLAGYVAREVMVPGHDGVRIPLSLVMRADLPRDGRNPTMIFGYGAYGIPNDPMLNPHTLAWMERGGIFAVAHVRGGGALGRSWHEAGQKDSKPNTWKDAISIAQWLVDQRYTQPAKLGIWGGSAGGILVGRAIIERPDLFAAAVPAVAVLDALRAEHMPGGSANVPEFGTVTREQDFPALLAMSSYHQLHEGQRLPAVMLIHGVNDNRVLVWQSSKFASRLASLKSAGKPVLLNLDYEAGHGQGSTREQSRRQMADIWSFMLWQFGDPDFQPRLAP
ncbi:prolyl oligopeptidase family serine peptidase [Roseateles toxinivorans]|uniref:Oligopeptidase B n=1 Tax=Roseateles toxinivorans TaxID=270368 RepID=A0A4R6QQ85_9BURK|nr:prolyl oligopeptidase family serine peptidase [Roseateles toxinivorans]TDP72268.1 oligopeptidase B [Roseateles toxinivorans]